MGFRFKKSVKAGPFRMTFSKSGVGFSAGVKGFRVTKKARGGFRATASIPGTGISYTKDSRSKSPKATQNRPTSRRLQSEDFPKTSPRKRVPLWAPLLVILLPVLLAVLLNAGGSDQGANTDDPPVAEPSTQSTTAPPAEADPYAAVDDFIALYNSTSADLITEISTMDIRGVDYRTEFRLNAFNNATGKKGALMSGTVQVVNYGVYERNEFRIYASFDTLDEAITLYRNTITVCGGNVPDQLADSIKQTITSVSSMNLGGYASLTGTIHTRHSNGGVSGYDIMLDGNVSAFAE